MAVVSTKRQMNWTGVTFTPTLGTAVTMTGVTGVELDNGGNLLTFSGDGDRFPTTIVNDMNQPSFTLTCADTSAANQFTPGLRSVFTATFNDAKNQAATGALTFSATNSVVGGHTISGQHRQIGSNQVQIQCESTDGVTSPITVTVAL